MRPALRRLVKVLRSFLRSGVTSYVGAKIG